MSEIVEAVTAFVSNHRAWAFWIALAFAAAETTAVLSILIPSTAILMGVGALVATGGVDFLPIWAGASVGAVLGSTFSYWLGLRYGDRLLAAWPLNRNPGLAMRGERMFRRRGAPAVFIGHFFGPVRPVIFLMAGMSRMRLTVFTFFNAAGAVIWAFVIPKSGQLGGDAIGWLWRSFMPG